MLKELTSVQFKSNFQNRRKEIKESGIKEKVEAILRDVQANGDQALFRISKELEKYPLRQLSIAIPELPIQEPLKKAIDQAAENIEDYHRSQFLKPKKFYKNGIKCWQELRPIPSVGLYVPGGTASLFSTLLMLYIPAKIAGVKNIQICSPLNEIGSVSPAFAYTCKLLGIESIIPLGGAQAIAAMAYGTESIAVVDKIFGPGNQYVTKAKELVQLNGTAIDMPAGPSEVLIIADKEANPAVLASDLLAQAEHGVDSQVILLSTSQITIKKVQAELIKQLSNLPRKAIAKAALANSAIVKTKDIAQAIELSNLYAPEHLILNFNQAELFLNQIENAGSVFIGPYAAESLGDYASGPNHTLPTNAYARAYEGLNLRSFQKAISFQHVSKAGLQNLASTVKEMAQAEGLEAHSKAIEIRETQLRDEA